MPPRDWISHEHGGASYEWCLLFSGWVKLREVGAGGQLLKQWKLCKRPGPYTQADALRLVIEYFQDTKKSGGSGRSASVGDGDGGSSSSAGVNGDADDDLPAVRTRTQSALFEPIELLRKKAMGGRWKKRPAGECCDQPCCKKARVELDKARAERATWQERAEAVAAELRGLRAEMHLEGKFWLVHIEGEAFPAPQDMALATDVFEEGYLVVATKWYELADKERRGYKLMPTVRHIMVNAMVFVTGLHFEGSQGGPQGRIFRQQPGRETGLSYLSQDMQNYILDAF